MSKFLLKLTPFTNNPMKRLTKLYFSFLFKHFSQRIKRDYCALPYGLGGLNLFSPQIRSQVNLIKLFIKANTSNDLWVKYFINQSNNIKRNKNNKIKLTSNTNNLIGSSTIHYYQHYGYNLPYPDTTLKEIYFPILLDKIKVYPHIMYFQNLSIEARISKWTVLHSLKIPPKMKEVRWKAWHNKLQVKNPITTTINNQTISYLCSSCKCTNLQLIPPAAASPTITAHVHSLYPNYDVIFNSITSIYTLTLDHPPGTDFYWKKDWVTDATLLNTTTEPNEYCYILDTIMTITKFHLWKAYTNCVYGLNDYKTDSIFINLYDSINYIIPHHTTLKKIFKKFNTNLKNFIAM